MVGRNNIFNIVLQDLRIFALVWEGWIRVELISHSIWMESPRLVLDRYLTLYTVER